MKGKGNVVSRSRTTEVTSGERPGPFMKRDVKGSVTGPTSVSAPPGMVSGVNRVPVVFSLSFTPLLITHSRLSLVSSPFTPRS